MSVYGYWYGLPFDGRAWEWPLMVEPVGPECDVEVECCIATAARGASAGVLGKQLVEIDRIREKGGG